MDDTINKKIYKQLLSFEHLVNDGCIITGGHFMLRGGQKPELNVGTKISFEVAIKIFSSLYDKRKKVGLGILINNIGSTCDTNVCYANSSISSKFVFPDEYKNILEKFDLSINHLQIFWEKHLRNRGKKEFIKRVKKIDDIMADQSGWWLKEKSGKKFMLTRCTFKDPYGTPACPLIMTAYNLEQEKKGYKTSLNFYYIDSDNFENIPNHFMIEKGYEVAKLFGTEIKVMNVYFTKNNVITNF